MAVAAPALTPAGIVTLWEEAAELPPLARAVRLAGWSGEADDGWDAALDLRDRQILRLHRALGEADTVALVCTCDGCGEPVELALDTRGLPITGAALAGSLRRLTSRDLADALLLPVADARRLLAARASGGDPAALTDAEIDGIEAVLEADGAGDVTLAFTCPQCGTPGTALFDPVVQGWRALLSRADALMHDIDRLARAYGWGDDAILALPQPRRRRLLELAG